VLKYFLRKVNGCYARWRGQISLYKELMVPVILNLIQERQKPVLHLGIFPGSPETGIKI
jgi:hypothetical protein